MHPVTTPVIYVIRTCYYHASLSQKNFASPLKIARHQPLYYRQQFETLYGLGIKFIMLEIRSRYNSSARTKRVQLSQRAICKTEKARQRRKQELRNCKHSSSAFSLSPSSTKLFNRYPRSTVYNERNQACTIPSKTNSPKRFTDIESTISPSVKPNDLVTRFSK